MGNFEKNVYTYMCVTLEGAITSWWHCKELENSFFGERRIDKQKDRIEEEKLYIEKQRRRVSKSLKSQTELLLSTKVGHMRF